MSAAYSNKPEFWAGVVSPVAVPLGLTAVVAPGLLARAFVLSKLWDWYATPFGLPHMTLLAAFGLGLFANVLLPREPHKHDPKRDYEAITRFALSILGPFVVLLIGWVGMFFA